MLTTFFEYVCKRVYPVMSLCVILKTWIETFAYSDDTESCCKKTDNHEHGCQSLRRVSSKVAPFVGKTQQKSYEWHWLHNMCCNAIFFRTKFRFKAHNLFFRTWHHNLYFRWGFLRTIPDPRSGRKCYVSESVTYFQFCHVQYWSKLIGIWYFCE